MIKLHYRRNLDSKVTVELPSSKSISNRYLLLQALSQNKHPIHNLSKANDTQLLRRLLQQQSNDYDVQDAGTVYRFLLPYLCLKEGIHTLRGTERLMQRPILPLIEALQQLGAHITFNSEGIIIQGGNINRYKATLSQAHSSQFASALLLSAAAFPKGLELTLREEAVSASYLNMTLSCLQEAGIQYIINDNSIKVPKQTIELPESTVENDWSSAAFFYQLASMIPNQIMCLNNLHIESKQGDAELMPIYKLLGVHSMARHSDVYIQHDSALPKAGMIEIDGKDIPDLIPSIVVTCSALGIDAVIHHIGHLRHKESDRIELLRMNLEPLGVHMQFAEGTLRMQSDGIKDRTVNVITADDHRIAMAFAPLCVFNQVRIDNESCVQKSFPDFWKELSKLGIESYES